MSLLQISAKRKAASSGFTMIELLVVLAIIIVLIGLTSGALTRSGEGRDLTSAGSLVRNLITNARQVAKTENTMTMIAVVDGGSEAGRAITLLTYSRKDDAWVHSERWSTLPVNVKIDTDYIDGSPLFVVPGVKPPLMRNGATDISTRTVTFLPSGRVLTNAAVPLATRLVHTTGSANNYYKIIVSESTGMPIVQRPGGNN